MQPAIEVRIAARTLTLPLADVTAMRAAFASCITGRLGAEHAGISVTIQLPVFRATLTSKKNT